MQLQGTIAGPSEAARLCEHMGCPRWTLHAAAFRDVIEVLQETKRRFKSKELAELRRSLGPPSGNFQKWIRQFLVVSYG